MQKHPLFILLSYARGRNMILQWDTNTSARFYTNTMIHDKQIFGYPDTLILKIFRIFQKAPPGICLCVFVSLCSGKKYDFTIRHKYKCMILYKYNDTMINKYPHHQYLPYFAGSSSWDLSLCQLCSGKKGNFCNQLHTGHCCSSIYWSSSWWWSWWWWQWG